MRIVVVNHLTLDGVMQGPGRADEDTRGGFTRGGWAAAADDPALQKAVGERMSTPGGGMLLGRRSYEDMLRHWNDQGGPFKDGLNAAKKYVASSDPGAELEWPNSQLLGGDVPAAVADLKRGGDGNLVIMGSGELIRSLIPDGLIDEFLLMIHPLLIGGGRRLFGEKGPKVDLRLTEAETVASGVLVVSYRPE